MKSLRCLTVPLAMVLAAAVMAADPIRMNVTRTFTGPIDDTSVMTVELSNDGPDARGVLIVSGDMAPTNYPVELPRGSRKRILTFPAVQWGTIDFTLQTNQKNLIVHLPASPVQNMVGGSVVLIGDDVSGLAFIRRQSEGRQTIAARDAYVKPEEAPGRSLAYRNFSAVVLGPGAERIGDETVAALKRYAIGGGSIVIVGGASAPILDDPRWKEALPGRGWKPRTISRSAWLEKIGGIPTPSAFTVLTPSEWAPGVVRYQENGVALESRRGLGLGTVTVMGYSLLEAPLSEWSGRTKTLGRFVRGADNQRARQFLSVYRRSDEDQNGSYTTYSGGPMAPMAVPATPPGSSPYTTYPYGGANSLAGDPFSTKLPDTATVFGILGLYFILVVPVSFLALRKLKRGELAWVTAPVLSLVFAGLLFKSAQGLYSSALSSATQGVVVMQEGVSDAMFYGTSQMFFPVGGVYDLKLEGVEELAGVQSNEYYGGYGYRGGYDSQSLEGFNLIDVGEIKAPQLEASNLAFREMGYSQRVESTDWFRFERSGDRKIKVENRSPYAFQGQLIDGEYVGGAFGLEPGASTILPLYSGNPAPKGVQLPIDDVRLFTRQHGRIAIRGNLKGFRPGPQIGKEIEGRSGVAMLAFAKENLR